MDKFLTIFLLFFLIAFFGWLIEVFYLFYKKGDLVNKGFLKGPFSLIYGFSGLAIIFGYDFFYNVLDLTVESFFGSFVFILYSIFITTVISYASAFFMSKIFKIRLWDYNHEFLNIHGFISLKCSLYFGLISYIFILFIEAPMVQFINEIPYVSRYFISFGLLIIVLLDLIFSIKNAFHFKKILVNFKKFNMKEDMKYLHKYKRFFYDIDFLRNIDLNATKESLNKKITKYLKDNENS